MRSRSDEFDLAVELRALRAEPKPEFAADLDARVAAGFPREDGDPRAALERLFRRLRTRPQRLLAPAGAAALAGIVVATAIVVANQGDTSRTTALKLDRAEPGAAAPREPTAAPRPAAPSRSGSLAGRRGSSGVEYSAAPPAATQEATSAESTATGPYATPAQQREVERSAQIVLGAAPADVRASAAKVFDAVHATDGIVLSSSIRDGAAGEAGARFELLIPSAKLGDALADLSAIGEVRSRREASQDITAPTVRSGEKLQDSRARIEGLLAQLTEATDDAERQAVEAQLRGERRYAAALRSELAALKRRANLSRVSVQIETGEGVANDEGSGAWGPGDGLAAAGRILAVAAGVTVVGLAALLPLALLCLLAWLLHRAWLQRARNQALAQ